MYKFIQDKNDYFLLNLKVIPNAKKTEIIGVLDDALKIKIAAPPVEGKANNQIIKFFCDYLHVSKSTLKIISGEKSKYKILKINIKFELLKDNFENIKNK